MGNFLMDQTKLCGTQSLHFQRPAYILSAASVAGKKEAEGPLGKKFDMVDEQDNLFGAKTWEEAESNMQKEACILAIGKAGLKPEKIRYLFGGDLLRQGIATSMGVEALQIPMFGLYGACSTSGEALALAAMSRQGMETLCWRLHQAISEVRKRSSVFRWVMPARDLYLHTGQ